MKSTTGKGGSLPLVSLNHISLVCRSVQESLDFYENVLGFVPIKRPGSFNFDGACSADDGINGIVLSFTKIPLSGDTPIETWARLFSYGMGMHLLQSPDPHNLPAKTEINPMDNHISFQCEDMNEVEKRLVEMNIKLVKRTVEEMGVYVDQLFFHDPDGFMIEVCNCENLPVVPLTTSCSLRSSTVMQQQRTPILCAAKADAPTISSQMLRVP